MAAATLLSRVLGYLRDAMIAWAFGTGFGSDAFLAAFRIIDVFRRLLGEGSLSAAFVPVLTEALWKQGPAAAERLAASALRLSAALSAVACAAGVIGAPWLVQLIAPGFPPAKFELTVRLARIMSPFFFTVGVAALFMAVLNVYGTFAAPALAPALLNAAMILALLTLSPWMPSPVEGLAVGVLVGGGIQVLFQLPFLVRHRVRLWRPAGFWHPALGRAGRLMLPAVLGGAVHQINLLAGTLLASLLAEGSIGYLYFSDRLVEFPLGIVAVAGATAILPGLARKAAAGDMAALRETFTQAFCTITFLILPAMAGLILLGPSILRLLLMRGEFGPESVQLTSEALSYYASGLWALAVLRIVVTVFFALQDSRTPVAAAAASVLSNLALGMALMPFMAHGGLALASALAALIQLALLLAALRRRLPGIDWRAVGGSIGRSLVSALGMSAGVFWVSRALLQDARLPNAALALRLAAVIGFAVLLYAGMGWVTGSPELRHLLRRIPRSLRR